MWAVPIRVALTILFVVAAVIGIMIILLVFFLFFFRFIYQSSRVAPFWFRIINFRYRKKGSELIPFSTSTRRRYRQMLNPFPPLTDSSTSVFWKLFGVGIKILILSSEVDLVWKYPDFNPGSLDETVSKRGLHAQSSLRSHRLLFVRRSPLGEWTVQTGERSILLNPQERLSEKINYTLAG